MEGKVVARRITACIIRPSCQVFEQAPLRGDWSLRGDLSRFSCDMSVSVSGLVVYERIYWCAESFCSSKAWLAMRVFIRRILWFVY